MSNNYSHTRIKKLSPLLINQLAAGEVVTRPSAVVKELLENAIDAGATSIEIRITQGGMGMIEVVDNGAGIHPDDMVMALTRHATSKVADIANLHGISTLGFRGEALAATAAVSRLTLISSHDDSGIGRQLHVAGVLADTPKLTPVVHNRGTTITVKDLYFNIPARRGNLKSIGTEFTHIESIVREVALARADVTLNLYHDHKKRLTLSATSIGSIGSCLPLSRLEQALGLPLADKALEISVDLSSLVQHLNAAPDDSDKQANISGWLWPVNNANQASQASLPKLLYVNGRLVKEALISNQLRQLATNAQLNNIGYALYFNLPHHWLNINVHPTKQRIKISPLNNIMAHLSHAIRLKIKTVSASQIAMIAKHEARITDSDTSESNIVLDSVLSKTVLPKTMLSKALPANILRQGRQVNAAKQSYQLSGTQPLSKNSAYTDFDNIIPSPNANDNVSNNAHNNRANLQVSNTEDNGSLPRCLAVINRLPSSYYRSSSYAKNDRNLPPLPWLLFYTQEQYLMISAQDWQSNVSVLFEPNTLKKYETPINSVTINQQITSNAITMSGQDFIEFKVNIEQMLSAKAMAIIDTEQLIAFMLSSAQA